MSGKMVMVAAAAAVVVVVGIGRGASAPEPRPWPEQFHSVLVMNYSGILEIIDLWYDWPNGRNFNIIRHQLGDVLYDLEWNNGTSFFYTLPPDSPTCSSARFDVGILRPDWLHGATYLGQRHVDGFLCHVWEKVEFLWYYEDVETMRPVHWQFHTGRSAHVMTFDVGATLDDPHWQAPLYCFHHNSSSESRIHHHHHRRHHDRFSAINAAFMLL